MRLSGLLKVRGRNVVLEVRGDPDLSEFDGALVAVDVNPEYEQMSFEADASGLMPWRCPQCGRRLADVAIRDGAIVVKCERCGELVRLMVQPESALSTA